MKKIIVFFLVLLFLSTVCDLRSAAYSEDSSKEEEALFVAKKALEDGFYEVSRGLFENFIKSYPNSPKASEANLLIGQCYFHQARFLDSLAKFEELLKQPQAKEIKDAVIYWTAEVHFKGNNFNKAAQYYKMVVDDFPRSSYAVYAYYSLGWCLFQERKFTEALEYFRIVEDKFPKEPQAQDSSFKVIECLYNLKDYTQLKDRIKFYSKVYPKDTSRLPYLNFYSGEAEFYLGNFDSAINSYSKVLLNTDDDKIANLSQLGMGWAYLKLKRYKEAEAIFSELKLDDLEKTSQGALLLGKAIFYTETKKFLEAANIYDQILGMNFDPLVLIQAYLGKADVLYSAGEYKKAVEVYRQAQAKISSDSVPQEMMDKLYYGLSWALLKNGEFKEAIDEFQKVAQSTEDKIIKVSALCQIGDAYQDAGDYNKAQETYDIILKDYPDSLYSDYVQYQSGLTMLKSFNYDGAALSFMALKKNFPQSKLLDDASYSLGLAYFQKQDYNLAKDILEKSENDFKDSNLRSQSLYLRATSLFNLGKFQEAIEVFKEIIRSYNQDSELVQKAEYEIADCLYQMGNEKEAMARFKNLRAKYPDSSLAPEVIWWLGEYHYRHDELSLARRYFSSLIQDFPKCNLVADAYYALGSIYSEESKYPEAVDSFKKVIEFGKSDLKGTATIAIADVYAKQGNFDLALKTYKDISNEYANLNSLVYPKLADIYYKTSDFDQAVDFYNKSLNLVPVSQMNDIQFKLADALQTQGKTKEAIEAYLKAAYLYPENSKLAVKSLLRVAAIYEDKEDFREALNIYNKIFGMKVEESKYALERIEELKKRIR